MNRVVATAACAVTLAGCAGMSDLVPSVPGGGAVTTPIRIESEPSGADARTSMGQSCRTPCALNVTATSDFTVTYSLAGHLPQTVTVSVARPSSAPANAEDFPTSSAPLIEPNPVYAQLERAPPPAPAKKQPTTKKKSPTPAAAAPAAPPAAPK